MKYLKVICGLAGGALCLAAWSPAGAQSVYKCVRGNSVTYSQQACSGNVISTREAAAPRSQRSREQEARRIEQNRLLAQTLRRRPEETTAQFDTRRRRAGMLAEDRQECARLEKRIPVEQARVDKPGAGPVPEAKAALAQTQKRFAQMQC